MAIKACTVLVGRESEGCHLWIFLSFINISRWKNSKPHEIEQKKKRKLPTKKNVLSGRH